MSLFWFIVGLSIILLVLFFMNKIRSKAGSSYFTSQAEGYNEMYGTQFNGNWTASTFAVYFGLILGIMIVIGSLL
jgi:hypothetical protein